MARDFNSLEAKLRDNPPNGPFTEPPQGLGTANLKANEVMYLRAKNGGRLLFRRVRGHLRCRRDDRQEA